MGDKTSPSNVGVVVSVRGSVVDIRFDVHVPPIHSVLRAGDEGRIVIEVLEQLDAHRVRGIVLTTSQGFARGMTVDDASELLTERDGKTFYFCGEPCRQKFLSMPPGAKPEKKSGGCCG
jgi:F-type H+-transporting ATPase subunit beta